MEQATQVPTSQEAGEQTAAPKRRGRAPGSRNRPKDVIEAEKAAIAERRAARLARKALKEAEKAGQQPKVVAEALVVPEAPAKRRPGRPKGSRNKQPRTELKLHRGPGRPKAAKSVKTHDLAKPVTVSLQGSLWKLANEQAQAVGLSRSGWIAMAAKAALANGIVATRLAAGAFTVERRPEESKAS